MNKIILPVVAAALAVSVAAPVFATEGKIFEYSTVAVTQDIEALGFNVTNVEEWGDKVVATVIDADGQSSYKYFDADTLTLVR